MPPSKRTLARLPPARRVPWETHRPRCEATLRDQDTLPAAAVTMAVSLDGVMAPMKAGERHAKRTPAVAVGQTPSGPAGYQAGGRAPVRNADLPRSQGKVPQGFARRGLGNEQMGTFQGDEVQRSAADRSRMCAGAGQQYCHNGYSYRRCTAPHRHVP